MLTLPDLSGRRVLILGATGFIGRWVARTAARAGAECVLQARSAQALAALRAPWDLRGDERIVDLEAPDAIERLLGSEHFDLVVNLAGYGVDRRERDENRAFRLNAEFPRRLGCALFGRSTRLVHAGSALEYGEVRGDLDEKGPFKPTTLYGRSKLAGSQALEGLRRDGGLACLTARLFTVYGPGEHEGRLLPDLIAAGAAGGAINLSAGTQRRDFGQVEEVARALLALGASPLPAAATLNLAGGRLETVREFCLTAARTFGISAENLRFGALPLRAEEMSHEPVSTRRLELALRSRLEVGLEEGLARTREFIEETAG